MNEAAESTAAETTAAETTSAEQTPRSARTRLLVAGIIAFAAVVAGWFAFNVLTGANGATHDVDLEVYRDGGLIVRHVLPYYNPHTGTPLYSWGGYSALALKFTYPPFAAVVMAPLSILSPAHVLFVAIIVNMLAPPAALWFIFGNLARRDPRLGDWRLRLGATLLGAALVFWLQPEIRTIYLGQVNLVLMVMIMWDLTQPDGGRRRWWKGFLTGIAAGIKLTPLIFIPYLLVVRRFREAAMTAVGFVFSVAVGFILLPGDSSQWWLHGLIIKDGTRTGFIGWAGNQSMRAIIARIAGSVSASQDPWLVAAVIATAAGLFTAYQFDRAGHRVVAILVTALTGLLDSPVSWDHHYVWMALGAAVAVYYAVTFRETARTRARWLIALAVGIVIVYGPWPDALWEKGRNLGKFSLGFLWNPPNTDPLLYTEHGDRPSFVEYHWHGIWLLTGNAYILGAIALMAALAVIAWRMRKTSVSSETVQQAEVPENIVTG